MSAAGAGSATSAAVRPEEFDGRRPGVRLLPHSLQLTVRAIRALVRQPAFAVITVVQPAIWLLLFGQLFRSIVEIPGFRGGTGSYLEFLTPGVVMMTALFSSGWAGTVYIQDMERGVMDRLLASPVSRGAMTVGTLAYQAITTVLQSVIVFAIAALTGARFAGGAAGIGVTVVAAVLLSVVMAAFSSTIALLVRQDEALIGISQFIVLPMQFLSGALMDTQLSPFWVRSVARFNPVDWAVTAARRALEAGTDWAAVGGRLALLAALATAMAWVATRAFAAYQRSL